MTVKAKKQAKARRESKKREVFAQETIGKIVLILVDERVFFDAEGRYDPDDLEALAKRILSAL